MDASKARHAHLGRLGALLCTALALAAALLVVAAPSPARADGDAATITETGATYATVQEALDAAEAGQTVVAQADVAEQLTISKAVTLDLGGHAYVYAGTGPGIHVTGGVVPTITNGTVSGTTSTYRHNAIWADGAGVALSKLTFTGNTGTAAVVLINDTSASTASSLTGVAFENNTANTLVSVSSGQAATLSGCTFTNNAGSFSGTGIIRPESRTQMLLYASGAGVTVSGCTFTGNTGFTHVVHSDASLLTVSGSTFSGNTGVGYVLDGHSISLAGTQVRDNAVSGCTVRSWRQTNARSTNSDNRLTLTDSVVTGNTSTGTDAGSVSSAGVYGFLGSTGNRGVVLDNSAVYGNTSSSDSGHDDFAFHSNATDAEGYGQTQFVDVSGMSDPWDDTQDFSNSVINDRGKVVARGAAYEARIGDTNYETFADAYEAAQDGDTITLTSTTEAGVTVDVYLENHGGSSDDPCFLVQKDVTIDLNGRNLRGVQLRIDEDKDVTLKNTGDAALVYSEVALNDGSTLTAAGGVDFDDWVLPNNPGGTLVLEGAHARDVNILQWTDETETDGTYALDFPVGVRIGDDFSLADGCDLAFYIYTDRINDTTSKLEDVPIVEGATEGLASQVYLYDTDNPLVSVVFKDSGDGTGTLAIHKASGSFIYLDGQNGSDDNDGTTRDAAVATFAKAEELAEGKLADDNPVYVYVCGTVSAPAGQATTIASKDGITYLREPSFSGNFLSVSGQGTSVTLKDVTLDGYRSKASTGASLVRVSNGASLTIADGATLRNSNAEAGNEGGAVLAEGGATVSMTGGTIENNRAVRGGGVYVTGAGTTFTLSGGTISGNSARVHGTDGTFVGGGGIAAWYGAKVVIEDGTVRDNWSTSDGGGICVGFSSDLADIGVTTLEMRGGTVSGNTADDNGGGICVASGTQTGYATATISGGDITGNAAGTGAHGSGLGNHAFAGGGIYVNGIQHLDGADYHNGVLYLENALISDNKADSKGAGIASCPTSNLTFHATDGAAIVSNTTTGGTARDLYVGDADHRMLTGSPSYQVSSTMLGGAPYHWAYDDGTEVPLGRLAGTLSIGGVTHDELSLSTSEQADDAANALARVRITGNESGTSGGGIGSNGDVVIGREDETSVVARKVWNDGDGTGRPASVAMRLYRQTLAANGTLGEATYLGSTTLSAGDDGSWSGQVRFDHLPKADADGRTYVYTVTDELDGYRASSTTSIEDGQTVVTVTNTKTTSVPVTKVWLDATGAAADAPEGAKVTVHLLADGVDTGTTLELSAANGWTASFGDLDAYDATGEAITYSVDEVAVDGYSSKVEGDAASGFTITNTKNPEEPKQPKTPETPKKTTLPNTGDPTAVAGMLASLLAGSGAVAAGVATRRRSRR